MDKLTVTVHESADPGLVNAGFQNAQRPSSYLATQDVIVPKQMLFGSICEQVGRRFAHRSGELVIVEPGVGLGCFFRFLLTQTPLAERFRLRLVGADVSDEMIRGCQAELRSIQPRSCWQPVAIQLHSRLNLLDFDAFRAQLPLGNGPIDVVLASQFEHYYPNSANSALAAKLGRAGLPRPTKREFRQFVFKHLREGGLYFSLDDYSTGDVALDLSRIAAWDAYIVQKFSEAAFADGVQERFPGLAASLRRAYSCALGWDVLVKKAASARLRRRSLCNEETATLGSAVEDLKEIFGPSSVTIENHPLAQSHGLFYLLSAQKARQPERGQPNRAGPGRFATE